MNATIKLIDNLLTALDLSAHRNCEVSVGEKPTKYETVCRGEWIKCAYWYQTNAYTTPYYQDGYAITVEKGDDERWAFYAEDHETTELIKMGEHSPNGYRTMREARAAAERFGEYFEEMSRAADLEALESEFN